MKKKKLTNFHTVFVAQVLTHTDLTWSDDSNLVDFKIGGFSVCRRKLDDKNWPGYTNPDGDCIIYDDWYKKDVYRLKKTN